jgi:NTE family protein
MTEKNPVTLVCGGGGLWGIAWMTGLAKGLADNGVDIRSASVFVGTSAGSVVGVQMTSSISTDDLFIRQTQAGKQPYERPPAAGRVEAMMAVVQRPWDSDEARLRAVCKLADDANTISAEQRRQDIFARLGLVDDAWPEKRLLITATDMRTLDLQVFDANSGVSLVDAVSASCAVPGVWPPTRIADRKFIDGGFWRTAENAHLAEGSDSVLILAPTGRINGGELSRNAGLRLDIQRLEQRGVKVAVIAADDTSLSAMAPGPLDPATRQPAAEAGRLQAANELTVAQRAFGF